MSNIADRFAEAQTEWKEPNVPAPVSLWVEENGSWNRIGSYDYYGDAMIPLVLASDKTAVLEMFGSMTELDDDENPTDKVERVRVLFIVSNGEHGVFVHRQDGDNFSDPSAEGMFLEMYSMTKTLVGA